MIAAKQGVSMMHELYAMHVCMMYVLCNILTPYFAAIIDSSGSSCIWGRKGGRLVRTDSILPPLCLKATPTEQIEEMEQQ